MRITVTWLRLDSRRRWRSLLVLALLVALATATVLAAAAGARRANSAVERLWTGTLPTTVTVLANQPGFDWGKVRALPEVAAVSEFPVSFGFAQPCCPDAGAGFPPIGDEYGRTIERPYMLLPGQHPRHQRPELHQRADPAQWRHRGHSRVPRRPGPGDRAVGHRRVEQPEELR